MSKNKFIQKNGLLILFVLAVIPILRAQEKEKMEWSLNQCIDYAMEHNIQVKKKQLDVMSNEATLYKAKSERLPNLNASLSQSFSNAKDSVGWSLSRGTSASLNSSLTLYNGGSISNNIKQKKLDVEMANLDIETTKNSITLSITQAYLNVLYAKESRDYCKEVVATSEKQAIRSRELLKAGSIARSDLAQIEAQLASDKYSLVQAENTLTTRTTSLKQLLEIPVRDTFKIFFPEIDLSKDYSILPSKLEALDMAVSIRPEIKSSQLSKRVAELDVTIAKSGYLPSLNLNASYSTNYSNRGIQSFGTQFSDNQNQLVGLSMNIPIFSRNTTKTSVQLSKINLEQAQLTLQETEKNLLQEVESAYQSVEIGKSRYDAALIQLESANESYQLSTDQFNLGMLNTIELLNAKSALLNAKAELIQSKYNAILSRKILDFYMGKTLSL